MGAIFAGNWNITRERWVGHARRRPHRFCRSILRIIKSQMQKFLKRPNLRKWPYYSKGTFWDQFVELVRFAGNHGYGASRGARTRIHRQNLGGTIFGDPGSNFRRKLEHNSRTRGRTNWSTAHRFSRPIFHTKREQLQKFFKRPNL